jgi:hypothetical protein
MHTKNPLFIFHACSICNPAHCAFALSYIIPLSIMATVSHGLLFLDYPVVWIQNILLEQCVLYQCNISEHWYLYQYHMRNENSAGVTALLCF